MIYIFKNSLLLVSLLLLFTSCGYKQENTQIRDIAYLKFTKSWSKSYTVVINDKYKFKLDACKQKNADIQCHDGTANKLYEITAGNTSIKVLDNQENLILHTNTYIGSSNTKEINLQ